MKITNAQVLSLAFALGSAAGQAAVADELRMGINWQRLNLTPQQSQQIQALEAQWNHDYMELQPTIIEEQHRLTRLLSDPKSDPLEIMALQQSIARKKEQLRAAATANYLRKRQLLNDGQQHGLEDMIHQAVAERQRMNNPGAQTDVMPDHIQYLIQRVRNIWTRTGDQ
jgi:Spy/CpxP family protein refolding chaperone